MMISKYMLQIFLTYGIASVSGFVDLTCSSSRPYLGDQLTCNCTTDSTTGIDWQNDDGSFVLCSSFNGLCTSLPAEYEVANNVSGTSKIFQLTTKSFNYTNCGNIICQDQAGADKATEPLSLYAFNPSVPASISENVQSDSGEISITTDCLYRKEEIKTTWYTISKGNVKEYTPDSSYSTPSPCASDVCGADTAYTLKNGFNYVKATKNPLKVKFKVKMYHESNTSLALELTTTDDYYIEGPRCWCWWGCCDDWVCIIFCWIVFVMLIAIILYFVGIIIGIIMTKTGCCCEGFYHCEDSGCECCRGCGQNKCLTCACCTSLPCGVCCNDAGLPFWVQVLWWSIIGTPVALGIYTVKCCRGGNGNVDAKCEDPKLETQSGNRRTGQKKSEIKNKSKISAHTENEQHNQGRKPREQPPIPLVAQTTETTMSGREDSDSAVSREHVSLQDSDRTLPLRPIPAIPSAGDRQGHDSKGRGLSANFNDDDHPLIGVDIPSKKAGALGALPEGEPVKKKKKKKKKQEEDRE